MAGFMKYDAMIKCKCPRCGAKPGVRCKTPSGRTADTHGERLQALQRRKDYDPKRYQARAIGIEELPAEETRKDIEAMLALSAMVLGKRESPAPSPSAETFAQRMMRRLIENPVPLTPDEE